MWDMSCDRATQPTRQGREQSSPTGVGGWMRTGLGRGLQWCVHSWRSSDHPTPRVRSSQTRVKEACVYQTWPDTAQWCWLEYISTEGVLLGSKQLVGRFSGCQKCQCPISYPFWDDYFSPLFTTSLKKNQPKKRIADKPRFSDKISHFAQTQWIYTETESKTSYLNVLLCRHTKILRLCFYGLEPARQKVWQEREGKKNQRQKQGKEEGWDWDKGRMTRQ